VKRKKRTVHEGELVSLRRVKENITEISQGNECGVGVANFVEWREGDRLEAVEVTSKTLTLEEASGREMTSNLTSIDEEGEEEWTE
jgi:translation initiation factor IF-2